MSLLLSCRIVLGNYEFTDTAGVSIESGFKSIGDTATVRMPGVLTVVEPDGTTVVGRGQELDKLLRVGDPVEIWLGYDNELVKEFSGYVAELKLTQPFEVRCEDEVYRLKRAPVNKTWQHTTLKALLTELCGQLMPPLVLHPHSSDAAIHNFRADRTTFYGVLKKLKEEYLMAAYCRNGQLFVGLPYTEFTTATPGTPGAEALYSWQDGKDYGANVVADDLTYLRKEDMRVQAQITAHLPNGNKRRGPNVGDPDGVARTLIYRAPTNTPTEAEMREWGLGRLVQFKYDGCQGSITGFGVPFAVHSGVADLLDTKHPQRTGRYFIDSVSTTFDGGGFRRKLTLGRKANY